MHVLIKIIEFLRKQWASRLEEGWRIGRGFFPIGGHLVWKRNYLTVELFGRGEQQKQGLIFALRRGTQDGGVDRCCALNLLLNGHNCSLFLLCL